tara:strand:+ start:121 stop:453 length:333 start_codon:yes stop_codon:yes gene_type:complete
MKTTVNEYDFERAFKDYGRENNFSRYGLSALYRELSEYEASTGVEIELDVIALCCEFTEYESLDELIEAFYHEDDEQPEYIEDVALMLENSTTVIHVFGPDWESLIVQDF